MTKSALISAASKSFSNIKQCPGCDLRYTGSMDECIRCGEALTRRGKLNQAARREIEVKVAR